MTRRQRRLAAIGAIGLVVAVALGMILVALRDRIVFFRSPTEIAEGRVKPGESIRLGGLVLTGSVMREAGNPIRFIVTDGANEVKVIYGGILPDLFREGQGVVAEGRMEPDGIFAATNILARHDENYMPREVADSLKKQGHWRDGAEKKP